METKVEILDGKAFSHLTSEEIHKLTRETLPPKTLMWEKRTSKIWEITSWENDDLMTLECGRHIVNRFPLKNLKHFLLNNRGLIAQPIKTIFQIICKKKETVP